MNRILAAFAVLCALVWLTPSVALADNAGFQVLPGGCGTAARSTGITPGTQNKIGQQCDGEAATVSAAISSTAAGTVRLIAPVNNQAIYVSQFFLVVSGAGTVNFIYGSGATCGTGTIFLTGATGHPLSLAANGSLSVGSGEAPVLIVPAAATGNGLCMVTTGAVDTSGSIAYSQY